jgi:hypothetical protein
VLFTLGNFLNSTKVAKLLGHFFHGAGYALNLSKIGVATFFLSKIGVATFWSIWSQTHLVNLFAAHV